MNQELMREQFESWAKDFGRVITRYEDGDREYSEADTDVDWMVWQASRAAVVIELPGATGHEYDPLADANYQASCREAISSQGLKVKS